MHTTTKLFFLLHLISLILSVDSQNFSDGMSSQDNTASFEPSLAVVIGMLAILFSLTFILLLYAKFCHRPSSSSVHTMAHQIQDGLRRSRPHLSSGVDKTVVESLPFFRFSSLKGKRDGLECAVCLAKFEDIEILRLLPKCKHAFHIECIDKWLEKNVTCPLCRQTISADDLSYGDSFRLLWAQPDESNLELYVEREESQRRNGSCNSSRFSIGSSFRKSRRAEEELPIRVEEGDVDVSSQVGFHRFNHRISVVNDHVIVLKNRWSNVSSSDLMFLNSEMLGEVSSSRFSSLDEKKFVENCYGRMSIKEEMERKRLFESKIREIKDHHNSVLVHGSGNSAGSGSDQGPDSKVLSPNEKRCMSEIVVHPRFRSGDSSSSSIGENNVKEERMRRIWLPIARKTVRWFANRERVRDSGSNRGSDLDPTANV